MPTAPTPFRRPSVRDPGRRWPPGPASGRAGRDPALGAFGSPASGSPNRVVGPGPPRPESDQVRDLLMSSPLPSGAQAAAQQFPLLAGVSPAMFVGLHAVAVPGRADRLRADCGVGAARPGAGDLRPAMGRVPGTGRRAGGTSQPMSPPAPVTASPSPSPGRAGGSQSTATPVHVPPGSSTSLPSRDYTPPAPIPSAPPVSSGARRPSARTPTPAPPTARQTNPPSQAPELSPSPTAEPPTPSASPPVAASSPAGGPASVPPHPARRCCADHGRPGWCPTGPPGDRADRAQRATSTVHA